MERGSDAFGSIRISTGDSDKFDHKENDTFEVGVRVVSIPGLRKGIPAVYILSLRVPIILSSLLAFSAWHVHQENSVVARIDKIVGDVQMRGSSTSPWTKASKKSPLPLGSTVRIGDKSLAIITFYDGSRFVVRPRTIVSVIGTVSGDSIIHRGLLLDQGRASFKIKTKNSEALRLASPTSVASIRNAAGGFSFDLRTRNSSLVVTSGSAGYSGEIGTWSIEVKAGETATVDSAGRRVEE